MLKPSCGLFLASANGLSFQPNPSGDADPDQLDYFIFIGKFVGKAIIDGNLLDAHFTQSFYKHILGIPISFYDLEAFDETYYKSLMHLLTCSIDELSFLDLSFSVEVPKPQPKMISLQVGNEVMYVLDAPGNADISSNDVDIVDLVHNGRHIAVTDENKVEYVRLLAHHRLSSAFRRQV